MLHHFWSRVEIRSLALFMSGVCIFSGRSVFHLHVYFLNYDWRQGRLDFVPRSLRFREAG